MLVNERIEFIVDWIKGYSDKVKFNPVSLIIGVSGGVDSAVASTLSAKTKLLILKVSKKAVVIDNIFFTGTPY